MREYDEPFELESVEDEKTHNHNTISAAVIRTMPDLAEEWESSPIEMAALLSVGIETYRAWSSDPAQAVLEHEQRERASILLGIYRALVILFSPPSCQRCWLYQPNQSTQFQGETPIERLHHGGLDARRELKSTLMPSGRDLFIDYLV